MRREKLIKYRGERSQEYMAIMYGVTQQAWSKWERGKAKPGVLIMKRIELDSGIPMESIFADLFNAKTLLNVKTTA